MEIRTKHSEYLRRLGWPQDPEAGHVKYYPVVHASQWYMNVLAQERMRHNMSSRSELLNALLLRHAGLLAFARSPDSPRLELPASASEHGHQVRYSWEMPVGIFAVLEACNSSVRMSADAWVVYLIHSWLGLPFPPAAPKLELESPAIPALSSREEVGKPIVISSWYMDVLEEERLRHNMSSRSELLNALLLRHARLGDLQRVSDSAAGQRPGLFVVRQEPVQFVWNMEPHIVDVFDACNDVVRMNVAAWVVYLVHAWVGLPFPRPPQQLHVDGGF
jgi:hypothetical protein